MAAVAGCCGTSVARATGSTVAGADDCLRRQIRRMRLPWAACTADSQSIIQQESMDNSSIRAVGQSSSCSRARPAQAPACPLYLGPSVDQWQHSQSGQVRDGARSRPVQAKHGAQVSERLRSAIATTPPAEPAAGASAGARGASAPRPGHAGAFLSRYPSGPPASSGLTGDVSAVRSPSSHALCSAAGPSS